MNPNTRPVLKSIESSPIRSFQALDHFVTSGGMRVSYYALSLDQVPADFFRRSRRHLEL